MDCGATYRLSRKPGSPVMAWTLIAAILIGAMPLVTGVVLIPDSRPAFTLDICHPLGAASYDSGHSEAPLIPAQTGARIPGDSGAAPDYVAPFPPRLTESPDTPPPKPYL